MNKKDKKIQDASKKPYKKPELKKHGELHKVGVGSS